MSKTSRDSPQNAFRSGHRTTWLVSRMEGGSQSMAGLVLSELEAKILIAVDHAGWHCGLWFPIVQRAMLNLSSDHLDEEVHHSLVGLIRKGLLTKIEVPSHPSGLDLRPAEWRPKPEALAAAKVCLDDA